MYRHPEIQAIFHRGHLVSLKGHRDIKRPGFAGARNPGRNHGERSVTQAQTEII
jgi:hypothetical protein